MGMFSYFHFQLYTSTQANAAKVLTNDRVQNVNYDLVIRHYPVNTSPERAANAIKYMVNRYRYIKLTISLSIY